jgi:hypothetical protein
MICLKASHHGGLWTTKDLEIGRFGGCIIQQTVWWGKSCLQVEINGAGDQEKRCGLEGAGVR